MFTFAPCTDAEIIEGLNAADIEAKEANLKFPKPMVITSIYRKYLMVLASFEDESQLEHPHLAPNINVPQEFRSGFVFLNFFRTLSSLADSAAIQGFSLADLFRPDKERVTHILSGLINFAFFREERLANFQEHQQALNEKSRENERMEQEIHLFEEAIARKQSENVDQRNEIEALETRKQSLITQLSEIDDGKAGMEDSLSRLQREEASLQRELDRIRNDTKRFSEELDTLKIQRDLSPEEIMGDLTQAQKKNEQEMQLLNEKRGELQTKRRQASVLQTAIDGVIEILDIISPIERDKRKLNAIHNDEKILEEEREQLELKRQEVERLEQQRESKSGEMKKRASEIKRLEDAIQKQRQTKKRIQYQHDRAMDELSDRMMGIRRQIQDYIDRLNDAMNRASTC